MTLVQFNNQSSGATDYIWYFGDGDTAMSVHPQHGFAALGMMDVMLVASDRGCLDTAYLANAIEILAPLPIIGLSDRKVCEVPGEVLIQDYSIGADTRFWTVNGIPASNSQSFSHLLTSEGTQEVGLTVSNLSTGCVVTAFDYIEVQRVVADFVPDTNRSCVPFNMGITNQSLNATKWWWDDGKGVKPSAWEPTFGYVDTGSYFPSLIIENDLRCQDTFSLEVKGLGVFADLYIQDPGGCAPYVSVFSDQSSGTGYLVDWLWDFGDGGISTLQHPTHIFDSIGTFDIQLTVVDIDGCRDSITRADAILASRPEPAFTVSPRIQCPSDELIFVSQSDGVGLSYLWDFGDGNTATLANPTHSYAQTGFYDIELTVTDVNGCDSSLSYPQFVQISELSANFTLDSTYAACPPLAVNFVADTSFPHQGVSYHWDFGNGATSNEFHPTHIYTLPGIYTVQLIVSSDGGCSDTLTMDQVIEIEGPTATFTFDPGAGCPGTLVSFEANANQPLDYTWLFGDGSTDQGQQIQHVYPNAGSFLPTLVIQDTLGCEVYHISEDTIEIFTPPATQFEANQTVWCESGTVDFLDLTVAEATIVSWEWSFGDGDTASDQQPQHTYTEVGTYDVQLLTTDANGCSDTLLIPEFIRILPKPEPHILASDSTGCISFVPSLQASAPGHPASMAQWSWQVEGVGDSIPGTVTAPVFSAAGIYQVILTGWDEHGCIGRDSMNVEAWGLPNPAFIVPDSAGCAPKPIAFQALDTLGITQYLWDLGDGGTDSLAALTHTYEQDGLYTVSLTLTDSNGCVNSLTRTDLIDLRPPFPAFSADPLIICPGESVSFQDNSQSDLPLIAWNWTFGDGDSLLDQHPEHRYLSSGWYDVQLTVTDEEGCVDSLLQPQFIEVLPDTAPAPVSMNWVSVNNAQSVELSFVPYSGEDFGWYEIYRSENGSSYDWIARLEDQTSSSFTDQNLTTESRVYCYRIVVVNHCGTAHLLTESDTHCTINLQQQSEEEAVILNWSPYEGWETIDRYLLYRVADYGTTNQTLLATLPGDAREYIDSNLFCYDTYSYRILAVGGPGKQSWSDTTFASPIHLTPDQPTHMRRVSVEGNQFLTVEWEMPVVEAAHELLVERNSGNGFGEVYREAVSTSGLKFQDPDAELSQQQYVYRAFVQDSCGDLTPMGRTGNNVVLQALRQNGVAQLQWNPYEGWEQGVGAYTIEVYNEDTESFALVAEISGEANQYIDKDTDLIQGSLCYRITAWESGGNETFSYSNEACVMLDPVIYGANAFSPNGDGVNDAFVIAGNYLTAFEMRVYNRWGKLVYKTRSPDQAWQGFLPDGEPAPEGVYMFVATGVGYQAQNIRKVGSITLVR
ncbi:MAG: PKD domain-containing protein [Bacteroidota bacterium]